MINYMVIICLIKKLMNNLGNDIADGTKRAVGTQEG
jgi:hypothetical protein